VRDGLVGIASQRGRNLRSLNLSAQPCPPVMRFSVDLKLQPEVKVGDIDPIDRRSIQVLIPRVYRVRHCRIYRLKVALVIVPILSRHLPWRCGLKSDHTSHKTISRCSDSILCPHALALYSFVREQFLHSQKRLMASGPRLFSLA
jgi:hypothetical protein